MLLRAEHTCSKTKVAEMPERWAESGAIRPYRPEKASKAPEIRGSHVQQVVAGELRLVGDEGEPGLGLGPHQPLDRIGGAFAVVGQQHDACGSQERGLNREKIVRRLQEDNRRAHAQSSLELRIKYYT